jgi:hypothetical protein
VTNVQKAKGDRAESAVLTYVKDRFPWSWRTRAGWDDDRGDVVLDLLGDKTVTYAVQVKDTAGPPGSPEMAQLAAQVANGGHAGGAIWWKLRGKSSPAHWRVVMPGHAYVVMMRRIRDLEQTVRVLDGSG